MFRPLKLLGLSADKAESVEVNKETLINAINSCPRITMKMLDTIEKRMVLRNFLADVESQIRSL